MLESIAELKNSYEKKKQIIKQRLEEFKKERSEEEIFLELCFCILTPQSKAKAADKAIRIMSEKKILLNGSESDIFSVIDFCGVRFPQNKARYIVEARKFLGRLKLEREWLVKNVKGLGYKESSHFLRNIGFSGLAILDRHIITNLHGLGVIDIPKTLTRKKYLEIEEKMKKFAEAVSIPIDELDLLLWSEETGEIFK